MGQRTDGDRLFEDYLRHQGIMVPGHEPNLGIGARIEYLLNIGGEQCATEVEEFAPSSWPLEDGTGSFSRLLKPHRTQIHEAARKLRNAKDLGHPLVVVLTDPRDALVGLLDSFHIIVAMMGDPQLRIPARGPVDQATWGVGKNGELRIEHPYVSAVVHIDHWQQHPRARTYITNSAGAVSLSPVFFRGADDLVWEYSDEQSAYVPVP